MAIRIFPFHVWLRNFPRSRWDEIREELYDCGSVPEEVAGEWRFVRVMSGRAAKLGVVAQKDLPELLDWELLWLRSSRRSRTAEFHMRTTSGGGGVRKNVSRYFDSDIPPFTTVMPEGLPAHDSPGWPRTLRKLIS